jgi:hypothetical protein
MRISKLFDSHKGVFALLGIALVVPLLKGQSAIHFHTPTTLNASGSRPLADMLQKLQQLYKFPITYEEVPYENPAELRASNARTATGVRPLFPLGGDLDVTLDSSASTPLSATQAVLSAYTGNGLPGLYQAIEGDGRVDVIPTHVRGTNGVMRPITPVMSQPVVLPPGERRIVDSLQAMGTALSKASGFKVYILSSGIPENATADLGSAGGAARDVIAKLGAQYGIPISFQALYEPNEKAYYVNLQLVTSFIPTTTQNPAKPKKPAASPDNPFFTKVK